eukprot:Phypoly_transcript_01451.p1 GENE.Phypoly_transcript_01451~~Phypoly_transcript_01451.p1  ORF type:complete len:645 (+),score=62.89 Phypoly_transcript_01451:274-2208(+)
MNLVGDLSLNMLTLSPRKQCGGAINIDSLATFTTNALVTGSAFRNNHADDSGGAVQLAEGAGNFVCTGCEFSHNYALNSGGAINALDQLQLDYGNFTGNSVTKMMGGAINFSFSKQNMTWTNCTFDKNLGVAGGALYATGSSTYVIMVDSHFSNNIATQKGGAIYSDKPTDLLRVVFDNNTATSLGGAIAANNAHYCSNCTFMRNRGEFGGGLYTGAYALLVLVNFVNNFADNGGAVYVISSTCHFLECFITNNTATYSGGAIYITSAAYTLDSSNIVSNRAAIGGGLYATSESSGEITSTFIMMNYAAAYGGGIYVDSIMKIENSTILSNAVSEGQDSDGIYIIRDGEKGLTMENVFLTNHSPFVFCCKDKPTSTPENGYCNYPSCQLGCGSINSSCNCNTGYSIPCNCTSDYMGAFCNIPNLCWNATVADCPGGCGYDQHYNRSCCPTGVQLLANQCFDVNECANSTFNDCAYNGQCNNTYGGYNCSCPSPLTGNGTYCSACVPGACSPHASCDTTGPEGQNFTCGNCSSGYTGNGIGSSGCSDIDECAKGDCDMHTDCTNSDGGYSCSACPDLYTGSGKNGCKAMCGDKNCSKDIGEDCITCPLDCPSPCGLCGDKTCSAPQESCKTCSEDCGNCKAMFYA